MGVENFTNASFFDNGFNGADIRIAQSASADPTAYAYLPSSNPIGGDVWFGQSHNYQQSAGWQLRVPDHQPRTRACAGTEAHPRI